MAILATALWVLAYPSLETARSFAFGWILQTWAINMGLILVIAGGLHWYFFMHPVEHFIYLTSLCIHWAVVSHPIHLIFHIIYQGPGAAMTHCGYEDLLIKDKRQLALGTFYHQLHHRYFECNYGNQEMPWDRWLGTLHDGSQDATLETCNRKKKMYK
jgi:sterol desaturase/sphingolipid hydroxylase (fatty acid hydroxylase superfamily)